MCQSTYLTARSFVFQLVFWAFANRACTN